MHTRVRMMEKKFSFITMNVISFKVLSMCTITQTATGPGSQPVQKCHMKIVKCFNLVNSTTEHTKKTTNEKKITRTQALSLAASATKIQAASAQTSRFSHQNGKKVMKTRIKTTKQIKGFPFILLFHISPICSVST